MKQGRVNITNKQIKEFCEKNHIRKFAFFGSVIRDDFRPDSDVDVLVEFEPDYHPIGLFEVSEMELEFSDMIGKKADLRTPKELSEYFRDEVVSEAEVQYEKR